MTNTLDVLYEVQEKMEDHETIYNEIISETKQTLSFSTVDLISFNSNNLDRQKLACIIFLATYRDYVEEEPSNSIMQ